MTASRKLATSAPLGVKGESPPVWLNASTGTIYRYAMDRPQTESDGELGSGFSVDVARDWEQALFTGDLPGTRRVALRMAIVLGDGPALQMLLRATSCAEASRVPSGGRRATHRPFGLPAYRWMLEPGMLVLRQESELLLKSRWVPPEKLLAAGFTFAWPELGPAITDLTTR